MISASSAQTRTPLATFAAIREVGAYTIFGIYRYVEIVGIGGLSDEGYEGAERAEVVDLAHSVTGSLRSHSCIYELV